MQTLSGVYLSPIFSTWQTFFIMYYMVISTRHSFYKCVLRDFFLFEFIDKKVLSLQVIPSRKLLIVSKELPMVNLDLHSHCSLPTVNLKHRYSYGVS